MSVVTFVLSKKHTKKIILDGKEVLVAVATCLCNSSDISDAYEGKGYHKKAILLRLATAERAAKDFHPDFVCFLYSLEKTLTEKETLSLYPYREGDSSWCDTPQYTGMKGKPVKHIKRISGKSYETFEETIG
jgi:hypothetical protein